VKTRLVDEHHRSKEELTKFLEKEIETLEKQEKDLTLDLDLNAKERTRVLALLEKVEKEKRAEEELAL
jgi:prefoldin subunit 5